jgi:hypothetical protein
VTSERLPALPGPVPAPAPERRPGSIRRTTNVDATRRAGGLGHGDLDAISGAGRDLLTRTDGTPRELATATVTAMFDAQGTIASVDASPDTPHTRTLVGIRVGFGFRSGARDALEALDGTLLGQLVDDFSGAPAPSGYGTIRERILLGTPAPPMPTRPDGSPLHDQTDVCAGWRADGLPTRHRREGIDLPFEDTPPVAPDLDDGADPLAWHPLAAPGNRQSRRIRRLDLWRDGDRVIVDTMFRDTTVDPDTDLTQRVVHEYAVRAVVAGDLSAILEIDADPRTLPFPTDCPRAAGSVQLIVGQRPAELRRAVGRLSRGPVSCTHLNDLMRSLADLPHLVTLLDDVQG